MVRVFSTFAFSALILAAATASAGDFNKRLKGDYSIVSNRTCVQSQAGFTPEGIALSPAFELSTVIERINTYDGNGNVTTVGHTFQTSGSVPAGSFPTSEADFTCSGTYEVDKGGNYSQTQTCSGTVVTGTVAGQTFTQSPTTLTGRVRGRQIQLKSTTAAPVVLTLSGAGSFTRLCGQAGSGFKIRKEKD